MLRHLIKYNGKIYMGNKSNLIWNFIFPFAYLTVFFMAIFSLSQGSEAFSNLKVAIVQVEAGDEEIEAKTQDLEEFFDYSGSKGVWEGEELKATQPHEDNMVVYVEADEHEAAQWLEDELIDAMVLVDKNISFKAPPNQAINSKIMQEFLSNFERVNKIKNSISKGYYVGRFPMPDNPEALKENSFKGINTENRKKAVYSQMIFFFSALAYVAYFPVSSGVNVIENIEANQSVEAKRIAVSPISKFKNFVAALIPRWLAHIILIILLYGFTQILGIDFGPEHGRIILLLVLGTSCAIFTGTFIGAIFSNKQGLKMALSIALPLFFAMASGMMASQLHGLVMEYIPWIHNINPLGKISNGLYALYLGDEIERYHQQLIGLAIITAVFFLITILSTRRRSHESL